MTRFFWMAGFLTLWLLIPQVWTLGFEAVWLWRIYKKNGRKAFWSALDAFLHYLDNYRQDFGLTAARLVEQGQIVRPATFLPDITPLHMLLWPLYWPYDVATIRFVQTVLLVVLDENSRNNENTPTHGKYP
jgi:hypothetical protein